MRCLGLNRTVLVAFIYLRTVCSSELGAGLEVYGHQTANAENRNSALRKHPPGCSGV